MVKSKVLCALSGGVDSSVAATLLQKQGYEVIGVTFKLFCYAKNKQQEKACCSLESIESARQVCQKLNIPHYLINVSKKFEKEIIQNFISEYLSGRTPNPCVRCNYLIKFPTLINYAKKLGIDFVATGHYVRKREIKNRKSKIVSYKLLKGIDKNKDQSYFLWGLTQKELKYALFPIGDYRKVEVRNLAKKFGLPSAEKKESQEICFIEDDYRRFIKSQIVNNKLFTPGPILNIQGKKIGLHRGLLSYTIGQRKGLGGGQKKPIFVIKIDIKNNVLIVGEKKNLYHNCCKLEKVNFIRKKPNLPLKIKTKIRYNTKAQDSVLIKKRGKFIIEFKQSQRAITPGQSAVFYQKDELVGGGIIDSVL